ncbi:MAG TPA: hypothetical protein DE060_12905 [Lentisphaeria bacterium]|nr:hypothetical protein [Lentisphaeria bacterium]HCG50089.1 hypothetical protein [Lentisphaeria bacterium]
MKFSEQMRTAFGGLDAVFDVRHDCHTYRQYSLCRYTRIRLTYFTLTELLTVIAIIAILAGMLLPALNSVRARAQASLCISNLKQITMSANMYHNDHNGYYIPYDMGDGTLFAYHLLTNYMNVKNHKILHCPLKKIKMKMTKTYCNTYGVNVFCISGSYFITGERPVNWQEIPAKETQVARPSATIYFMDSYNNTDPEIGISELRPYTAVSGGIAHAPHDRSSNIAWCDGSVRAVKAYSEFGCYDILGNLNGVSRIGNGNYWDRSAIRNGNL